MPSDLLSYPSDDAEGNDDAGQGDEIIQPYTQAKLGVILSQDTPRSVINDRAGIDGNTFESRLQFREFTRLEIQGVWHRISDFYEWKFHRKLKKDNGNWVNDNSILALGNSGF